MPWWNALASRIIPSQLRPSSLCVGNYTVREQQPTVRQRKRKKKKENSLRYFSSCAYIIYLSVHRRAHSLRAWSKRPGNLTAWAAWRVQGTDFGLSKTPSPCIFFFFCTFIGDLFTKRRKRNIDGRPQVSFFFCSFPTAVYFGYIDFPSRYVRWFRLACANFWRDPNEMIRFLSRPHTHTCPCSWEIDNNKRTTFKHHVFFFALRCRHASRLSHVCSGRWPEYNISSAFLVFFRKDITRFQRISKMSDR